MHVFNLILAVTLMFNMYAADTHYDEDENNDRGRSYTTEHYIDEDGDAKTYGHYRPEHATFDLETTVVYDEADAGKTPAEHTKPGKRPRLIKAGDDEKNITKLDKPFEDSRRDDDDDDDARHDHRHAYIHNVVIDHSYGHAYDHKDPVSRKV